MKTVLLFVGHKQIAPVLKEYIFKNEINAAFFMKINKSQT